MNKSSHSDWYNSVLMTAYLGFILYEVSVTFRQLLHRWWELLKAKPKLMINRRFEQELRELLKDD
jgi:hypothetical protein